MTRGRERGARSDPPVVFDADTGALCPGARPTCGGTPSLIVGLAG
ncbi:hypothetical protein [Saccharothrix sp. Mg75]